MQTLHRTLMGITLVAALAFGVTGFWGHHSAAAQHGQHAPEQGDADPATAVADYFHLMLEELALTSEQRETLAEPLGEVYVAMRELHRLHAVIAAELTDEQKDRLAGMVHGMLMAGPMEHDAHGGDHHDGGHH